MRTWSCWSRRWRDPGATTLTQELWVLEAIQLAESLHRQRWKQASRWRVTHQSGAFSSRATLKRQDQQATAPAMPTNACKVQAGLKRPITPSSIERNAPLILKGCHKVTEWVFCRDQDHMIQSKKSKDCLFKNRPSQSSFLKAPGRQSLMLLSRCRRGNLDPVITTVRECLTTSRWLTTQNDFSRASSISCPKKAQVWPQEVKFWRAREIRRILTLSSIATSVSKLISSILNSNLGSLRDQVSKTLDLNCTLAKQTLIKAIPAGKTFIKFAQNSPVLIDSVQGANFMAEIHLLASTQDRRKNNKKSLARRYNMQISQWSLSKFQQAQYRTCTATKTKVGARVASKKVKTNWSLL